jgi:hypothetical protein
MSIMPRKAAKRISCGNRTDLLPPLPAVQSSTARQVFDLSLLENAPNLVGPIGTEHHQKPYCNLFRQSDRNLFVNIPGVYSDVNRRSGHSVVFYF